MFPPNNHLPGGTEDFPVAGEVGSKFGGEEPGLGLGAIAGLPTATTVHLDIELGISVSDSPEYPDVFLAAKFYYHALSLD